MADTMEELSGVKVRDLISVYESKANATQVQFSRPRAKSLGNVLSKNVTVKENEVSSLEDVEKALNNFEDNLSQYSIYNKQKHVDLQNQLFNILTSIANVKNGSEDDATLKKYLTTTTLSMVSSLNQKLPSNTVSSEQSAYKYTSYEAFKKQKKENEHKQKLPASKPSTSGEDESAISVKQLRDRYQSQNQDTEVLIGQNVMTRNDEKEYKAEYLLTLKSAVNEEEMFTHSTAFDTEIDENYSEVDAGYTEKNEDKKDLSVSKLRKLFEKKSGGSSRGLQVVLNGDEAQYSRFKFKVSIPYIGKKENDNSFSTISNDHADQDMSTGDHVIESMTESNYTTAYNSINEFENYINRDVESDSDPSSSESTESAIEIK